MAKKTATPPKVPTWVRRTRKGDSYSMMVWDDVQGSGENDVDDITREEFISLKKHLWEMRQQPAATKRKRKAA